MIYLDNAATTLHKPPEVTQAVVNAMANLGNAARGAHGSALDASRQVYDVRCKLARLFGCSDPSRVIFTANSTEALNIAIFGTLRGAGHVLSTDLEHNSVLRPLYALEEAGTQVDFVPADAQGRVNYRDFETRIRPDTRAIVCTHGSNLTGNLLDIARIGAIARKHSLLFVVDASQTAGSQPIHMEAMHIDILCFTGHKGLFGPQGTGGLCIGPGIQVQPWKLGGSGIHSYDPHQPDAYPTRLEAGTLNTHGIAGLGAALDFLEKTGISTIAAREQALARQFYEAAAQIPGITLYGDFHTPCRCPIVTLNIRDYDSGAVADALAQDYGIATRAGAHCAPRMHRALGTQNQGAVRFSFSWFNTEAEVAQAIAALRELAAE